MAAKRDGAQNKIVKPKNIKRHSVQEPSEPPLSLDRIVAAAVDLLDAEGIEGLTMRRLADRLGSGVMSLYWHVDNKENVLDLALDRVLAHSGASQTVEARQWRSHVVHMLEDWRVSMLHHPWSMSLLPRRTLGPNILNRLELLSKTLSRGGVADADLNVAVWALWNYVMGATVTRASFNRSDDDQAAAQLRLAHSGENYPTIERAQLLLDKDWDGTFKKGLDFLLDGLSPK